MSIATLATYALPPVGLGMELFGKLHIGIPTERIGEKQAVTLRREGRKNLAGKGKTFQHVAAHLFLARTAFKLGQAGDLVLAGSVGMGNVAIFLGGSCGECLRDEVKESWANYVDSLAKMAEGAVICTNLLNVLILNGSKDINVGGLGERIGIGTSMGITCGLSLVWFATALKKKKRNS